MTASLFMNHSATSALAEYMKHESLSKGSDGEERLVLHGISWQRYLAMDKALGDDRPNPRFYYLGGELEIMTLSNEHERIKKWLGGCLEIYLDAIDVEVTPRGQATMRIEPNEAGAEPDESWSIGEEKEFPNLVLEIAITSGGVNKLELYRRFCVAEVWIWRRGKLDIYVLRADGSGYERAESSDLLPGLDTSLLERCVAIQPWKTARQTFREGLSGK